jgi:N-acetylmuramoyl-L-alanine amidase
MFLTLNLKKLLFPLVVCILVIGALVIAIIYSKDYERGGAVEKTAAVDTRPVLIIDAGHGGEDGGCTSVSGQIEADVNLLIALKLRALAGLVGINSVMTRETAEIGYPASADTTKARKAYDQKTRIELINSVENALLISIHQNKFPDARPCGAQVLYAKTQGSDDLAAQMQESLRVSLHPENRRVAAPIQDTILIMKSVSCPAILIECGFLSNPEEDGLLATDGYRLKVAAVIISSYANYIGQGSV